MNLAQRVAPALAAAVMSAMVLTGCASSQPRTPAAQATQPGPAASSASPAGGLPALCDLLTKAHVAEVAGVDIPLARAEPGPGIISCAYHLGSSDATPAIFVQYQLNAASVLDFTNSGELVTGVGQRAKWYANGAKMSIQVNDNDLLIVNLGVSNKNLRGGDLRALATDLALAALSKI